MEPFNRKPGLVTLAEGETSVADAALHALLSAHDTAVEAAGVKPDACLGFVCGHSLPDAILLLALLQRKQPFVLLPRPRDPGNDDFPDFCRFRIEAPPEREGAVRIEALPGKHGQLPAGEPPSLYIATSGSTGKPKLVVHSLERLVQNARNCVDRLGITAKDRILLPVPVYHMFGLGAALLPGILAGATIEVLPGANLLSYLTRERALRPTMSFMTPPFLESILRGRRSPAAHRYRAVVVAGDRLKAESALAFEEACGPTLQLYGSTELGAITASSPEDPPAHRHASVGRPLEGVRCRIAGGEARGELEVQHGSGFRGYLGGTGRVDEPMEDTWFATRDLATLNGETISVIGRTDHSVNRDGILLALRDVELAMEDLEAITSAILVPAGQTARGRGMVLFCEAGPPVAPTAPPGDAASAVRKACRERLPALWLPDWVRVMEALPRLPNGKIDRKQLEALTDEVIGAPNDPPPA